MTYAEAREEILYTQSRNPVHDCIDDESGRYIFYIICSIEASLGCSSMGSTQAGVGILEYYSNDGELLATTSYQGFCYDIEDLLYECESESEFKLRVSELIQDILDEGE